MFYWQLLANKLCLSLDAEIRLGRSFSFSPPHSNSTIDFTFYKVSSSTESSLGACSRRAYIFHKYRPHFPSPHFFSFPTSHHSRGPSFPSEHCQKTKFVAGKCVINNNNYNNNSSNNVILIMSNNSEAETQSSHPRNQPFLSPPTMARVCYTKSNVTWRDV